MPIFDLIKQDPLVATTFYLEIQGETVTNLTSVDGLAEEIEVSDVVQRMTNGQYVQHKVMAKSKYTGELTMKRYSPLDAANDSIWKWFNTIRNGGMPAADRSSQRKSGSIVLYDTSMTEIARWNFTDAWPSKIETDGLDVTKNDPVSETVTIQYETLVRKK